MMEAWIICDLHIPLNDFQYSPLRLSSTISLNWIIVYSLRSISRKPNVCWSSRETHGQRLALVAFLDHQRFLIESLYSLRDCQCNASFWGACDCLTLQSSIGKEVFSVKKSSVGFLIPKPDVFLPQRCCHGSCHHWYLSYAPPQCWGVIYECSLHIGEYIHCFLDFGLSLLSCRGVLEGCSTVVYPLNTYLPELQE